MKNKLKSFFTTNLGWKILALVCGILLWILISSTQDPTVTKTLSIPVTYENEDLLMSQESTILLSTQGTIEIDVTVKQSQQNKLKADLFTCTADLIDHSGADITNQRVYAKVTLNDTSGIVLDWSYARNDPNVTVSMDKYISKEFKIGLKEEEDLPEGLLMSDSISFNPESVTVSGPESFFGNVASVKAVVNLQELSEQGSGTITMETPLYMFDANDQVISEDEPLVLSTETAVLTATVLQIGFANVTVEGVTGTPAEGYKYYSATPEPKTVSIYGLKSKVASVTEIQIPAAAINIDGIEKDTSYEIDLKKYLPDGISIADENSTVTVTVSVEELQTVSKEISTKQLTLTGKKEGYNYSVNTSALILKIKGFQADLEALDTSKISLTADVSALDAGTSSVPVKIGPLSGYTFANEDTLSVSITVTENSTEAEEGSSTQKEASTEESGSSAESRKSGSEASDEAASGAAAESGDE